MNKKSHPKRMAKFFLVDLETYCSPEKLPKIFTKHIKGKAFYKK